MDGLLVIDKPTGPTSHDVVVRVRRALQEPRVGHTGTLDPLATGVLPIVVGRATRLARFLSASDKEYDATIRLGVTTDSGDSTGTAIGPVHGGPWPTLSEIDLALSAFRGTFLQQPPALSAKKVAGRRSYSLARARARRSEASGPLSVSKEPVLPAPAEVTVHAIHIVAVERDVVRLTVECAAGFYVRALARDLGDRLGLGGHLIGLRRTRSGSATESSAVQLGDLEADDSRRAVVAKALIPLHAMLPELPGARLSEAGVRKISAGRDVSPLDVEGNWPEIDARNGETSPRWYRLTDGAGRLLALAVPRHETGLLHPAVVLV